MRLYSTGGLDTAGADIKRESLESMTRHGLKLLASIFNIVVHDELVELVRQSIVSITREHGGGFFNEWIDGAATGYHQYERREQWYTEYDRAQDRKDRTPFEGDAPDVPNIAWVTLWKGEANNLFGSCINGMFRRWGYVMWDAPRLEPSGAMWFLCQIGCLPSGDPQDDLAGDIPETEA
jgi:hypothetical protein